MARCVLLFVIFTMIFLPISSAEKIELKSGKMIIGEIIERTNEYLKIDSGIGVNITLYLDEIERIDEDNPSEELVTEKRENIGQKIKDDIRKEYYPDGSVHYERSFKNEQKDGLAREYYENGNVKFEVTYVKGKMHGELREYYSDGILKDVKIYVDGEIEGVSKQYNTKGELTAELTRDRGEFAWWKTKSYDYYPNGSLKYEYLYDQKIHGGYRKDYYENGQVSLEFNIRRNQFLDCKNYDQEGNFISAECPEE